MTNLLLADEINRTSSRTQSALLEVMEEGQVTVDGVTRNIPEPFLLLQRKIRLVLRVRRCFRSRRWIVLWFFCLWDTQQ